jgi:DNA-binding response OmpR family regulator
LEDQRATLLIVEDNLDIAITINTYFRIQGYEVLTVNWGEDGVRAAQTNNPDLSCRAERSLSQAHGTVF